MDTAIQKKVRAATFEVVFPKPPEDLISYEKPLPFELLPFQYRNDKYLSIGTAFAIGNHRYVTAAHVLNEGIGSQFMIAPAVRDGAGHVYPIDKILQYSSNQDFVVFSLANEPTVQPLQVGARPAVDEPVYAVGNALGEGIVIRDGLHTSDTPEERDGRWNWLRFSAAASPGNSGGPLLDKMGHVVGIVLRKSPNENLNYALSIDEVLKAKDKVGVIDDRDTYVLDVLDDKQIEVLRREFPLPKSYADFSTTVQQIHNQFTDQLLHDLLAKDADHIFPHGDGSTEMLLTLESGTFPALIKRDQDGRWKADRPDSFRASQLPNNGFVRYATLGFSTAIQIQRPDNAPIDGFYHDSKTFMDTVLLGAQQKRTVGPEQVKIVSLGKAQSEQIFIDGYQRKWQLRVWSMPYCDYDVISLALPVPSGYIALHRYSRTAERYDHIADLEAIANFVSVSYRGTMAQWQDFLKQSDLLPAALTSIQTTIDYGHRFEFKSPRYSFAYDADLQPITKDSELSLDFNFFNDQGRVVWDASRVWTDERAHSNNAISVARHEAVPEGVNEQYLDDWSKMIHRQHPYDAVIGHDGDLTTIHAISGPSGSDGAAAPSVLYSVTVRKEGAASQDEMKASLDSLMGKVHVSEKLSGPHAVAQNAP
jgi:hypothetical protein